MGAPVYLGDEPTAAGFRLAGLVVRTPAPGVEATVLAEAMAGAPVVLVSASVAARIPGATLRAAVRAPSPVVVVVPDLREGTQYEDLAGELRLQLGLEA